MKAKDLRERSLEDLKELEKSLRNDVFQNRLKNFTNRLDDTSTMKKTRREIARVTTLIAEKTRGEAPAAKAPKAPKAVKVAAPKAAKAAAPKAEKPAAKKTTKKSEAK